MKWNCDNLIDLEDQAACMARFALQVGDKKEFDRYVELHDYIAKRKQKAYNRLSRIGRFFCLL